MTSPEDPSSPMTPTDTELLQRMQCGDGAAFSTLYQRHQQRVFRFAMVYCGAESTAADVTQEVFMQLIDNHSYDPAQGDLRGYLLGMARNLLRRHWRDAQRYAALDDGAGEGGALDEMLIEPLEPSHWVGRAQQHGALREAILALPAYYREVTILCELEELDYQEAARILEVPIGTVRSRLNRARKALAAALAAPGALPERSEDYELRAV